MIPPRSLVSRVYWASPSEILSRSFESISWRKPVRRRPVDVDLSHVRDVERPAVGANGPVLLDHARILDRHLVAGEGHHPRAEREVARVERRALERRGLHGRDSIHWSGCVPTVEDFGHLRADSLLGAACRLLRVQSSLRKLGMSISTSGDARRLERRAHRLDAPRLRRVAGADAPPKPVAIAVTRRSRPSSRRSRRRR